jgi:anti-sigma regulatory factor (Ser/Thr protein kinase)
MSQIFDAQYVSCIPLPSMASSVTTARIHTRDVLERWRLLFIVDDAELVVSELVTNAIRATNLVPPQARYSELYDRLEIVCLCLHHLDADLLIEVWDPRLKAPTPRKAGDDDEGGRGLLLVEALSSGWGTYWPKTAGKTVWATISLRAIRS